MTRKTKDNQAIADAEYGVDSRYTSKSEREIADRELTKARKERRKNLTTNQVITARLLQLKLKMEEFIKNPVDGGDHFFTGFLATYIDTVYSKRNSFAKDIDITPVLLSQILNKHREPGEEFMLRLMVHSEKTFQPVCEFPKAMWHQVLFHEKMCHTLSTHDEWRPGVESHVKTSALIKT
jgi:hypothetical protein